MIDLNSLRTAVRRIVPTSAAPYINAILSVVLAALLQRALAPLIGHRFPFALLFLAVLFSAWVGGLGPGLASVLAGIVAAAVFLMPEPGTVIRVSILDDSIGLVLFCLVGLGITLLGARMRREARAARAAADAEHEQSERLRITLASIGDAVIVTDAQGRIESLNAVAASLVGWTRAEAAGRPLPEVFRIVSAASRRPAENPAERALREGRIVGLANHTLLIARDGRESLIDDSASPIRSDAGEIIGCVLVFRDVTDKYRAEEEHQRLAAIVESSDDAIIGESLDGTIVTWNRGAERLYEYTADEAIGRPISMLVPPGNVEEIPDLLSKLRRGERIDHVQTVRVTKSGQRLDVSISISPIRDREGMVIGASKIARDITATRRTEASLRFLSQASMLLAEIDDLPGTFEKVASLAVSGFADWCTVDMLTPAGALVRLAAAHADPAKAPLAHDLHRRHPPDPAMPHGVWNILHTGRSELLPDLSDALLEVRVRDPELRRTLRELGLRSYMGVPIVSRGRSLGVLTFVSAEARRRYTEADLRLAEDLARRAAIAVENARLYVELKETDRRKDEFLAMLAHELRNPLAPVRSGLDLLRLDGVESESVEVMRGQVEHLVRLVDDLLDVSRIMRGKIQLRRSPVEVAAVVQRAIETARPLIDAQEHELSFSLPPDPVWINGDPVRLAQVVGNLLNNAAKYTDRRGHIALAVVPGAGDVAISVRDDGIGIEPELLPRVFDLFTQADQSLERSQGGLGIGLTLVQRLVEMHGGAVLAQSEGRGKGSEFVVRLPVVGPVERTDGAPTPPVNNGARRILIVDDNVGSTYIQTKLLEKLGSHRIEVAHDGPGALERAARNRPDLILLDIGLPHMSGFEVARRLRGEREFDQTLLVALTGYGTEDDRRRSLEAGFDIHLIKPASLEALRELFAHPKLAAAERQE